MCEGINNSLYLIFLAFPILGLGCESGCSTHWWPREGKRVGGVRIYLRTLVLKQNRNEGEHPLPAPRHIRMQWESQAVFKGTTVSIKIQKYSPPSLPPGRQSCYYEESHWIGT